MTAPALDRPTLDDVMPLVCAYTGRDGFELGGSFHVVLDDGNLRRVHLRGCREAAAERGDAAGVLLGDVLLTLSLSQMRRLYRRYTRTCSYRLSVVGVSRPVQPSEVCRLHRCPWRARDARR